MKKVVFAQDLGIERSVVDSLVKKIHLKADWSLADGKKVNHPENVIAIVTVNKVINKGILDQFINLKTISVSFTGYDHIDKEYCEEHNISVFNVPAYSTDSVAELGIGLAISLLRQIPFGNNEIKSGNRNENMHGFELAGKVCGIIGTGTIGCRISEILTVFKCPVIGWSRSKRDSFTRLGGVYKSIDDILLESDILFITAASNKETKNLISKKQLVLMKKSAYIINLSRGALINSQDLIEALDNDTISGAALDVYDTEPLDIHSKFRTLDDNSVLTPHIAYKTKEALHRKATITIDNINNGLTQKMINKVI